MGAARGGGVFISYRREESSHFAGRLADHLKNRFGAEQVFIDVETLRPGTDFAEEIFRAVDACAVLVAVIGRGWLSAADVRGGRRLDDPHDLVRLEIGTALARGVRVIPVLAEGAVMPGHADLPDSLAGLARSHALRIRHESFRDDARRLVAAIERVPTATSVVDGAKSVRFTGNASTGEAEVKESPGTERNDHARAARLLGDAEYLAKSLTSEYEKARALSGVAAAAAATDPARAARLLGDVEYLVNSLTSEYEKAWVLSGVVAAAAATDPARAARLLGDAERIVASPRSGYRKDEAVSGVATAVAATDPDRAEYLANSLRDGFWKGQALGGVAAAVAATDPDRAERIANSLRDRQRKEPALSRVAAAMAATDPDRAERIASSLRNDWKDQALKSVAAAVAATDPDRAERIANSITDRSAKASALSGVATAVAATDPARAARLLGDAERIANSIITDNSGIGQAEKARTLSVVAAAVAAIDPDRAERIAHSITNKSAKASALIGVARALTA